MQKRKPIKTKKQILSDNYVNMDTGEVMESELGNKISLIAQSDTNHFVIESDDYVSIDTRAMVYILNALTNSEMCRVMKMSTMAKTDCSVLYNDNNHPHTSESLCITLQMEKNKFYLFMRKLVKLNILAYCICAPTGIVQKLYLLNPYIARKRRTIHCELSSIFKDITEGK